MRTLPGYELPESSYAEVLSAVDKLLWELVYAPVVDVVRPALPAAMRARVAPAALQDATALELHNAGEEALRRALRLGKVQILPDHTGKNVLFAVSQPDIRITDALKGFGAQINKATGLWYCPRGRVPAWVHAEGADYAVRMRATHDAVEKITRQLDARMDSLVDAANLRKAADHAISEVTSKAWKLDAKQLEVKWEFGRAGQAALADAYRRTRSIDIRSPAAKVSVVDAFDLATKDAIKLWAHEALERLREQVAENAEQGFRAEGLADRIRNEYGVSKGRADQIAGQETRNFMAAYRRGRAADAGLFEYGWYCVRDSKTRPDHRVLHNTVQRYDRPPITDTRTGARNNPGEDFRCRCVDRPRLPS